MTARVAAVLARTPASVPCSRCLTVLGLAAGAWHAIDHGTSEPVCDRCAAEHDHDGWRTVAAFRRMAAGPSLGRAA